MADIILNSKYAPGIATYGSDGKTGPKGDNGKSIFFIPIEANNSFKNEYIDSNKIIGLSNSITYYYQYGDTFIQKDGKVFIYGEKNSDGSYFTQIGELDLSSNENYFSLDNITGDFITVKDGKKILFTNTDLVSVNKANGILNIKNDDNNANFIYLESKDSSLSLNYDYKNKNFKLTSNANIFIDNLYTTNSSNFKPINGYFPILTNTNIDSYLNVILDISNSIATIEIGEYIINDFVFEFCCNDKKGNTKKYILNDILEKKEDKTYYAIINYDINANNYSSSYLQVSSIYNFTNKFSNIKIPLDTNILYSIENDLLNVQVPKELLEVFTYSIVLCNSETGVSILEYIEDNNEDYSISNYDSFYFMVSFKNKNFFYKSETYSTKTEEVITPNPQPVTPTPIPTPSCPYECGYETPCECDDECSDCIEECVFECLDDCIEECLDECTEECVFECLDECPEECTEECIEECIEEISF